MNDGTLQPRARGAEQRVAAEIPDFRAHSTLGDRSAAEQVRNAAVAPRPFISRRPINGEAGPSPGHNQPYGRACRLRDSCYSNRIREGMSGQARSEPSVAPGRAELSCLRLRRPASADCGDEAGDDAYGRQGHGFKTAFANPRLREHVRLILRVRDSGCPACVVAETPSHQ